MSQQKASWDLGRFVKTLSYFGAIPILSDWDWFQQWFGSRPHPQVDSSVLTKTATQEMNDRTIFDFTQPNPVRDVWGALDDVVMGGVSESGISINEAGAIFSGIVSTANSGGFVSVRTRNFEPPIDLSTFTGIELRLKGDGNRYKFFVRTESQWDGVAHCASFDTTPNEWLTIRLPFSQFVAVFRAKTVDRPIDLASVRAFQLMLSKFEYDGALNPHFTAGGFQLQIQSIKAYGE